MTLLPRHWIRAKSADYRTRRTAVRTLLSTVQQTLTAIVFAGGLSLAEYETANGSPFTANSPTVEYTRGPDMGGGVGGLLYSSRSEGILPSPTLKYALSNGRGDIVAQSDQNAVLTWTASYEAYGKRTRETGSNADKQRANSKDEDPTGLLNEGFRYRDLETGVWLSRDPAGFVDGPNLYAYVKQNPWSAYDAEGLFLNFIAGAVIGAAIDAGAQLLTEGKISSWSSIAVSAGMGATGVGLGNVVAKTAAKTALTKGAQLAVRIGANAASGAVEGATEQVVRNAVDGKSLTDGVGKSALVGMASSVGGDAAGAGLKKLMGPSAGDLRDLANETLALQKGADGFKTVGAASAKDINGKNQILVASSDTQLSPLQRRYVENRGGVPVRDAPGTKNHAEVTIMNHADSNNMTVQKIETTRPICTTCEPKVKERAIETTSPFKSDEKK